MKILQFGIAGGYLAVEQRLRFHQERGGLVMDKLPPSKALLQESQHLLPRVLFCPGVVRRCTSQTGLRWRRPVRFTDIMSRALVGDVYQRVSMIELLCAIHDPLGHYRRSPYAVFFARDQKNLAAYPLNGNSGTFQRLTI